MKRPVLTEHLPGQMTIFEICGEPANEQTNCAETNLNLSVINTASGPDRFSAKPSKKVSRLKKRQTLTSDLLTALFDDAGLGRRPTCNDLNKIRRIISKDIPEDIPSPVTKIVSARRINKNIVARLHLFDGGTGTLTVRFDKDEWMWDPHAPDKRPFHYINGAWSRFDEAGIL
ncbi:hypothetical protein [Methylobacterium sp. 37f]|uniref:hypothetical protein n=1 Tax=Methylobacterium sp. 37f TaxID=2817058 RepID=UPI001FFD95C5|nr:hypothetical protein [Methylobacterium sp. 37f]MCK2056129.1 hypothetical protein [Methylobacterium sp. 37f]